MIGLGVRTNKLRADSGGGSAPVNVTPPSISGVAIVGQTLTRTLGTYSGTAPITVGGEWYVNGVATGDTDANYTVLAADAGKVVKWVEDASNSASSIQTDSNTVAILATLLDLYPNAAAAYSVRLLRGAHYTSSAIRVRRSNDNAEQDIGFTTAGELNTSALATFVGANSGFVVTWYDQSGNANNATQTTPANQPRIVNAGVIDSVNGKTSFRFDGSNDTLQLTNTITPPSGIYTAYGIGKRLSSGNSFTIFGDNTVSTATLLLSQLATNRYYFQRNTGYLESAIDTTANQMMLLGLASSTNLLKRNGALLSNSLIATSIGNNIRTIGQYNIAAPTRLTGDLQEAIVWSADQTANVTGIESNVNTYYAIY